MKYLAVQNEQLIFAEQAIPTIKAHQCLIKVAAIGVNRADLLQRAGKYPAPAGESNILGIEVSGTIAAMGAQVNHWQKGDRVYAIVPGGGYAQYVAVNAEHLIKTPETMTDISAAGCAETFLTAYQALITIGQLKQQETVLIHAGASGVGSAAIQLAKQLNCTVVTTVGSAEKKAACLALGADHVINYHEDDFETWSKANMPQGYNLIIDVVAGQYLNKNIAVTALDGRIIILSMLGGRFAEQVDIAKMLLKRVTICASTLRNRSDSYKADLVANFNTDFSAALQNKLISPLIDTSFSWQDAEKAHQQMAANKNIGKLVLVVD